MSSQHPGAGPRPASEPGADAGAAPMPVTTPSADGQAGQGWGAPPAAPGWGAPGSASGRSSADRPWTVKRGLAVGGVAAVLAVGAGTGVYALTSSAASANGSAGAAAGGQRLGAQGSAQGMPGSPPDGQAGGTVPGQDGQTGGGMPGQGGPGDFAAGGMGGMAGGLSAAVHAEYVVLKGGTYVSMAEQLGTVSEVNSTSVTVRSSDGFNRTYALGSDVAVSTMPQRRQQSGGTGTQLGIADIVSGGTVRIVAAKDGAGYKATSVVVGAAVATGQTN